MSGLCLSEGQGEETNDEVNYQACDCSRQKTFPKNPGRNPAQYPADNAADQNKPEHEHSPLKVHTKQPYYPPFMVACQGSAHLFADPLAL